MTGVEVAVIAALGAALGWLAGTALAAFVADRAGASAADIVRFSVLTPGYLLVAVGLAGAAALVLAATVALRPLRVGGLALSPLDVSALAALAVVAVALARGEADKDALLREGGTGVVLLLIPGLVAFSVAVLVARLLPPVLRLLERLAPRRAVPLRLAAVSLARNPGHAAAAVAFLVVSIGFALFAETYRATLARGHADQAEFAVPTDFVLREDLARLIPVRDVATPARLERLPPDVEAHQVTRIQGNIPGAADLTGITVLGVPADAIPGLDGWREDFSATPLETLARRIAATRAVDLAGSDLPSTATSLVIAVTASGPPVTLEAVIRARDRAFTSLELGTTKAGRRVFFRATVPTEARGGRLVALRLIPPRRTQERGADAGRPVRGRLTLEPIAARHGAGRSIVTDFAGWTGVAGARTAGHVRGVRATVRFTLTKQLDTYFRPHQPTDGIPVPVLASPRLAALVGAERLLPLNLVGQQLLTRVVGIATRFPGATRDFVVADEALLTTALNAAQPGSGFVTELWVDADSEARRKGLESGLRRAPFDVLELDARNARLAQLRREPIGRASLLMLAGAAVVALVLALTGLLLATLGDLRDERGELFDLEAQGASPAALRRHIRLRAAAVALFGLAGGALTGAALSALVISLVALTASAARAEPPLLLSLRWPVVAVALGVGLTLAALLLWVVTAVAFRSESVLPYGEASE